MMIMRLVNNLSFTAAVTSRNVTPTLVKYDKPYLSRKYVHLYFARSRQSKNKQTIKINT